MDDQRTQVAVATALKLPIAGAPPMLPPRVVVPIIVALGYVVFLLAGFGTGLSSSPTHDFRSLPLYIFFGILLLLLQAMISRDRNIPRIIYIFLTSGFALFYGADVVFFNGDPYLVRNPYFYIVLNVLLFVVFAADAIGRHVRAPQVLREHTGSDSSVARLASRLYNTLAADFGGLAVLCYAAWGLLVLLHSGIAGFRVAVDLRGLHLPGIAYLENVDLIVGLLATAVALAFLVVVGLLISTTTLGVRTPQAFWRLVQGVVFDAANQGLLSLRLVLSPLVWLIPAFSMATFARQTTVYLDQAGHRTSSSTVVSIVDLFNPFSPSSMANYLGGLEALGLGIVALLAVLLAVAVVEHSADIVERTLRILAAAGRAVALTFALFLLSLAAINAAVILLTITALTPFQVGAPMVVALVAAAAFSLYAAVRQRTLSSR